MINEHGMQGNYILDQIENDWDKLISVNYIAHSFNRQHDGDNGPYIGLVTHDNFEHEINQRMLDKAYPRDKRRWLKVLADIEDWTNMSIEDFTCGEMYVPQYDNDTLEEVCFGYINK